jgi:rhodanese-related sulfurtransferase
MSFHLLAVAFVLLVIAGSISAADHTTDSLATVRENVTGNKAVLVDVREKPEWTAGHLAGAVPLPISAIERKNIDPALLERLPKDRILYTYCLVGMRSKKAAGILEQRGYKVRALKPGYEELLKAGFENSKGE